MNSVRTAVRTIAATSAAVLATATAGLGAYAYVPEDDSELVVYFQDEFFIPFLGEVGSGSEFEDISLEIYNSDGELVAHSDGDDAVISSSYPGVVCDAYYDEYVPFEDYVQVTAELDCWNLPADTYTVGTSYTGVLDVIAVCELGLIDFQMNEPLAGPGSSITLGESDAGFCNVGPAPKIMWVGQGSLPPYSYTLDMDNPPTTSVEHDVAGIIPIEGWEDSSAPIETEYGACLPIADPLIGWAGFCILLLAGDYTVETDTPDHLVAGPMYCASADLTELIGFGGLPADDHDTEPTFARTSTVSLQGFAFGMCIQYLGHGVPIYVDIEGEDLTEADLADLTVEAYDKDGVLVATAKDPSLDTCVAATGAELPGAEEGLVVNDSSACAVLWVKPPFSLISGDEVATETYTLGISGAKVKEHTLTATDLTWEGAILDYDDFSIAFGSDVAWEDAWEATVGSLPFDLGANEPISGATVTLSADPANNSFSSGALTTLDVVLAADDELPQTGVTWQVAAVVGLVLLAGGGALVVASRREV